MSHTEKNVILFLNGAEVRVDVLIHGREGSKAPKSYYILHNGRIITPYEQRRNGWTFTLNTLFRLVYGPKVSRLVYDGNPILDFIKQDRVLGLKVIKSRNLK